MFEDYRSLVVVDHHKKVLVYEVVDLATGHTEVARAAPNQTAEVRVDNSAGPRGKYAPPLLVGRTFFLTGIRFMEKVRKPVHEESQTYRRYENGGAWLTGAPVVEATGARRICREMGGS